MPTLTDRTYTREATETGQPGEAPSTWSRSIRWQATVTHGDPQPNDGIRTAQTYAEWMPTKIVVVDVDYDDDDDNAGFPPLHERTITVTGFWIRGSKLVAAKTPPVEQRWYSYSESYTGPGSFTHMPAWVGKLADELAGPFDRVALRAGAGIGS